MPTIEQLNNMSRLLYESYYDKMPIHDPRRIEILRLTIAAIQAKALSDIAYNYGFNTTRD